MRRRTRPRGVLMSKILMIIWKEVTRGMCGGNGDEQSMLLHPPSPCGIWASLPWPVATMEKFWRMSFMGPFDSRSHRDKYQRDYLRNQLGFGYPVKSTLQEDKLNILLTLILGFFAKDLLRLCPIFGLYKKKPHKRKRKIHKILKELCSQQTLLTVNNNKN